MGTGSFLGQKYREMTLRSIPKKKCILRIFLLIAGFWRNGNLQERDNRPRGLWSSWGLLGFGPRGKLGNYHLTLISSLKACFPK